MLNEKENKAIEYGKFIIEREATVRSAAKQFGCSKSKVYEYVTSVLDEVNPILAGLVADILSKNKRFALERATAARKNLH